MSSSQWEMGENEDLVRISMNNLPEVEVDEVKPLEKSPEKTKLSTDRRADIDVIIIFLTYGIYLFHLCLIYIPSNWYNLSYPNITLVTGPVSEDPFTIISPGHLLGLFVGFMDAWNMPMFFYLSGQNAYSALFRRSETQFRDERVHRLLVPTLFLSIVTQFPLTLSYFAPRETPLEESYSEHTRDFYRTVNVHQAWFLIYLFIYAQMFTYWFRAFHPAHNTAETTTLSCCGSTACCCTVKPFNCLTKFFCCLSFIFKPVFTPEEFVSTVRWFLGGPIRLAFIPGILIGHVQAAHNLTPFYQFLPYDFAWFAQTFPFVPYMIFFVLGYATGAADKQIRQDSKLWSWTCFIVGAVLCTAIGPVAQILSGVSRSIAQGFMTGIGQWLYLIGSIALAREKFTAPRDWHKKFRMMAMPFYLIHQQVIVSFAAGALWVPYLRTLPVMLIITSIIVITLSFLITKSGPLRYFFGLPPPKGSCLPGKQLRGFVPVIVLSGLVAFHILLANLL